MRINWILSLLCLVSLGALIGCTSQTPAQSPSPTQPEPTVSTESNPESISAANLTLTPVPSPTATVIPTTRPKPDITLQAGKAAFYGKVVWGDKPVASGEVVADTRNPLVPSFSSDFKQFTASTDDEGNYVLVVEPGSYFIGCAFYPNSAYHTYDTWRGFPGSHEITGGELTILDLEANDWAIELVSPGSQASGPIPTLKTNMPLLTWKPYDWAKYDGEQGYYKVELGIIKDGYDTVLRDTTHGESYQISTPLESEEYRWEVQAFSSAGKEIAGTKSEYWFFISSSASAPRPSKTATSMQTQVIVAMPNINSIADLDGKKLGMRTTEFKYADASLSAYHIDCKTVAVTGGTWLLALQQGVVDAVLISDHPSSDLQAIVDSLGARILPWSSEAMQVLADQFPEVAVTALPANTYPGQDNDILGYTIYE